MRKSIAFDNGVDLFVSGDQLLKGAALNSVQIADYIIKTDDGLKFMRDI